MPTRSRRRLSLLSIGTAFVASMILVLAEQWYFVRRDIAEDFTALATVIAANASAALLFDDQKAASELLSSLAGSTEILEAGLFRSDGEPLAAWRRNPAAPEPQIRLAEMLGAPSPRLLLREMHIAAPVAVGEHRAGTLTLRVSFGNLYADLARFLAGFVVIAGFALMLARLVTRRLEARIQASEQAQKEADARLRSVTDHLPVVLFEMEAGVDGARFAYVSEGATQLLGLAAEALVADAAPFFAAIDAADAARLQELLATAAPGAVAWSGRFRRAPDSETWIEMRADAVPGGAGPARLVGVVQDIAQIRRYQEEIEQSRVLLQRLASHRESVIDAEHKRIAVEIHDQLGQILTTALLHLRVLGRSMPLAPQNLRALIADIDSLLNEAYRSMKDIAASLRPAALNFGFAAAAEWLAERMLKNTAIRSRIDVQEPLPALDERCATALFRIVQEALSNCVRHSNARNVTISLAAEAGALVLTVADDGCGMAVAQAGSGFGLLGIRERALALGGTASIESTAGGGTTIRVVVPPDAI